MVLKHAANRFRGIIKGLFRNLCPIYPHFSIHFSFIVMGNQTVDQPGNCRFSTAAFAAKYDALTVLYGQIYIMDSTSVLVFFSIRESHMVNPYHRFTPSRQKEICC